MKIEYYHDTRLLRVNVYWVERGKLHLLSRSKARGHLSICSKDQGNWTEKPDRDGVIALKIILQYFLQVD